MLPKALKASRKTNIGIKNDRYVILNKNIDEINEYISTCRYDNQKKILTYLINNGRLLVKSVSSSINTLINKGIIKYEYEDGTPAHTIKKFCIVNRYDLSKEFPIITIRKTAFKSCIDELLWIWQKKSNNIL